MNDLKGDLISRQAAVYAIYHHFPQMSMDEARMIMHEIPSADSDLYKQGWDDGQKELKEEIWEYGRDRLD